MCMNSEALIAETFWRYVSEKHRFPTLYFLYLLLTVIHRLFLFVCFVGFLEDLSLFPCLTCFTVSKEHPLFTYSRAPGLFSSNNLSQVSVSEPWDAWQANKGHTSPWNIYKKHTCSVILALNMHPRNGTWLPLIGCNLMIIGHRYQVACL